MMFPAVQGLPNGLLLKGLLRKKWKGLARWFKSPIPTDPGLKWGNYYHYNYYCQVILRCQESCCTGEGGFPGPKRSNHHWLSQVGGSCSKLERLIQQKLKYLGLIWLQHQIPLYTYTPFKKRRLKINPGSGLHTAMEFHRKES